ncbi:MAG: QueT transporter family protein [Actinomycetota bacterium]|nr:QueT transporter family protein [Actinomycetota bacterium]
MLESPSDPPTERLYLKRSRYIAQAGIIAAAYAAVTLPLLLTPLGYGPVQLRLSEAATVLALFTPAAIPGLALGAVIANSFMLSQVGLIAMLDVVFGSIGSLLGAVWMWRFRERRLLALAGPVLANALIVPAYLPFVLAGLGFYEVAPLGIDVEGSWIGMYLFGVVAVGIGQAIVVYGLGLPLAAALERTGLKLWFAGESRVS